MRIDHRLGLRRPARVEATLHCPPIGNTPARISEYSQSGLLVGTTTLLPLYSPVSIVFVTSDRGTARLHRLHGHVVRRTPRALGIMLDDDVEPSALSALGRLSIPEPRECTPVPCLQPNAYRPR